LKFPNLQRCRRVTKSETEIRRRLKKRSRWAGFGVHDAPDSVFTMGRIRRSRWPGKCNLDGNKYGIDADRLIAVGRKKL
jgi:hypothetical protein